MGRGKLGDGARLLIGEKETLTLADKVAEVKKISGIEKSRNMVTIEAGLEDDADSMIPGKLNISEITVTVGVTDDTELEQKKLEGYLENGTLIFFGVLKPNKLEGKGGPGYISKITPAELASEGVLTQDIIITPQCATSIKEITVTEGVSLQE